MRCVRLGLGLLSLAAFAIPPSAWGFNSGIAGRAVVLGALLGLIACDSGLSSGGPRETCTEFGVQCQLPAGPLGVCERSQCGANETPPCFKCTPQH